MKQDQKHNLVQRSQHFFFVFLFFKNHLTHVYTNPAAGSLRHKCYDPGKPNNHTTVQFLIMLQWSYHQMYYSPFNKKTGRQHFRKESAPRYHHHHHHHHHQRRYIYPYVYIHTPNHRDTRIFVQKNIMFFPQSNTHIRTLSPGAYIYTIVFCCVWFFSIQKKLKCWHIKANFSTTVISAIFKQTKQKKKKKKKHQV